MANDNIPLGFNFLTGNDIVRRYLVANGDSLAEKDTCYLDSSGYAADSASSITLGVTLSNIIDGTTGAVNSTSATASYDYIDVYIDPYSYYDAQISTGALTSPYTTRSSGACYDEAGNAGVQYIDAASSSNDTWKVVDYSHELDTGEESAAGSYQKVVCKPNAVVHAFGVIA